MSHEIELKLELDPKDARTLADQGLLRESKSRSERLISVYYDTPGGKLRKNGYSLRVRSTPDGYVQTVKSLENGAGLFFRQEWEAAVDSIEPHVEELARTPAGDVGAKRLRPVVCSAVDRTRWDVHDHHSELEVSLDDGELRADEHDQPVCELEIELKKGEPAAAFHAARKIAHHIPLRLGVLSKAERAFALADGLFGKPTKAEPVPVRSDMSVAEGFATILQLDQSSAAHGFRSNVGFAEISGENAVVLIEVLGGDGSNPIRARFTRPVAGGQSVQFPLSDFLTSAGGRNLCVRVSVESGAGRILAYGVSIDNISGDAIYIPAETIE